jgi:hypothetical protein
LIFSYLFIFTGCICIDSLNNFNNTYIKGLIDSKIGDYQWGVLKNNTYKKEIKEDKIYFYILYKRYGDNLPPNKICKYIIITDKSEKIIDYEIIENEENCLYRINCVGPF